MSMQEKESTTVSAGSQELLLSEKIRIERKTFFFDLKENPNGRFLKITEEVGGRRDTIIVPASGLHVFRDTIEKAIAANLNSALTMSQNPE